MMRTPLFKQMTSNPMMCAFVIAAVVVTNATNSNNNLGTSYFAAVVL